MRFSKGFVLLVVLSLAWSGAAFGQTLSDTDFVWMDPALFEVPNNVDTNFSIAIRCSTKTTAAAISVPLGFAGHPQLRGDTTINTGGNLGVTYGPLGNNAAWTLKTSLVDNGARTILLGFISFGVGLPPSVGVLANVHFDLDASGVNGSVSLDTTLIPPANRQITFDDALANSYLPVWDTGHINIGTVGVGGGGDLVRPFAYSLRQNYPNPFNANTKIEFSLAAPGKVQLTVFNVLGQKVKALVDKELPADKHAVVWDGTNDQGTSVASGVYFYRIKVGDSFEQTHEMVLLK